jgi:putative salt-induced outer membrane protein
VLRRMQFAALFLSLSSAWLFADQIVLKNGDRLTGTVVKSDGKTLVLKTESAGDVTIKWDAIQQITSDQQLHVSLANGQTAVGAVTTTDGKIEIATKSAGTVEAPKETVTLIRNPAEQAAYDKSLHPGLLEGWNGGINLGFAMARGNSETENLAVAFNAIHPTLNDKVTLYANSVYTKNDAAGAVPSTVANLAQGGIRYDRNIEPRLFVFVGADFSSDALQALNLRSTASLGLGFHAIKNERTTLDVLGGGNFTHESYTSTKDPATLAILTPAFQRNFGALTLGEELTHKISKSTVIAQKLYFYPDLTQTGEYRGTFDLGTVTKINKWLGWQNEFGDIYVTNPPAGKKQNDIIFTTGLNFSFTH